MTQPAQTLDVGQFMTRHLVDVFATMLSLTAAPLAEEDPKLVGERVTGSVGFAGETIQGVLYLHLSAAFASTVAAAMLGLPLEELGEQEEVDDVIREVSNMLAGGLKSAFCDSGRPCALSTPAITRGSNFDIKPPPNLERIWLVFQCEGHRVAVEVHLRLK